MNSLRKKYLHNSDGSIHILTTMSDTDLLAAGAVLSIAPSVYRGVRKAHNTTCWNEQQLSIDLVKSV